MGAGEYISVSAQADTETADVDKQRDEQAKGPAARARALDELIHTYLDKGLEYHLAREVIPVTQLCCACMYVVHVVCVQCRTMHSPLSGLIASFTCSPDTRGDCM